MVIIFNDVFRKHRRINNKFGHQTKAVKQGREKHTECHKKLLRRTPLLLFLSFRLYFDAQEPTKELNSSFASKDITFFFTKTWKPIL